MSKQIFELIRKLNVDADDFYSVLNKPDSKKYKRFYLDKRSGGKRMIEAPIDENLKNIQHRLLTNVLEPEYERYNPKVAHGYTVGKSILTNAKTHFDKSHEYVLKIDLVNFFNSITYERLYGLFSKIWMDKKTRRSLLDKSTINALCLLVTCNKHLPQGACTSPVLSNMVCKRMDEEINKYCKARGVTYTRYADDMTFSFASYGDMVSFVELSTFSDKKPVLNSDFTKIIESNGFRVNEKKTKIISKNKSQKITGIVINEKINVRREYIRNLRAIIHKFEQDNKPATRKLIGKVNYLRQVRGKEDALANKYALRVNRLGIPPFPDANFRVNETEALKYFLLKIETPGLFIGTGFIAGGYLVTSKHVLEISDSLNDKPAQCQHGFWPNIIVRYYNSLNMNEEESKIHIEECTIYNEIAFARIDKIELFKNKSLKLIESTQDIVKDTKVLSCGYQDIGNLTILKYNSAIIDIGRYMYTNCIYLKPGSIFKGMSGGPVFDNETYKVIGVNFTGPSSTNGNLDSANCTASIITKGTFKRAIKWEADEIGKIIDPQLIEKYGEAND